MRIFLFVVNLELRLHLRVVPLPVLRQGPGLGTLRSSLRHHSKVSQPGGFSGLLARGPDCSPESPAAAAAAEPV